MRGADVGEQNGAFPAPLSVSKTIAITCIPLVDSRASLQRRELCVPSVSRQQPFHVSNNGRWRLRQSLNAPNHLIGTDRADIDAEFLGLFEETRVTVSGEKRCL
jgi:hypothetical protein